MKEGREDGLKAVAVKALERGFTPQMVVELTGLPLETVVQLEKK